MTKIVDVEFGIPNVAGQFDTFNHWVATASHTISEPYCPKNSIGLPLPAVCIDTKGRRCNCGGDFMRARDDGSFPVIYFWDFKS